MTATTITTTPDPCGAGLIRALLDVRWRWLLLTSGAVAWLLLSWILLGLATLQAVPKGEVDFLSYWDSARQFQQGLPPYQPSAELHARWGPEVNPNLNHPTVLLLMLPFAALPLGAAMLLWNLLSVLALLAALWLLRNDLATLIPVGRRRIALVLALTFPGLLNCLNIGQLGVAMVLPTALAWVWLRRGAHVRAGAAVGALAVLKPFLLPLFALFLPRARRTGLVGGVAGAAGVSLVSLPVVGLDVFREWAGVLGSVSWYVLPMNVSIPGVLHRGILDAGGWATWAPAAALAGLALVVITIRPPAGLTRAERDLPVLLLVALLSSPLGWLYYLPMLLPAAVAVVKSWSHLVRSWQIAVLAAIPLLWLPHFALAALPPEPWSVWTLGAAHTYGMVLLLGALALPSQGPVTPPGMRAEAQKLSTLRGEHCGQRCAAARCRDSWPGVGAGMRWRASRPG